MPTCDDVLKLCCLSVRSNYMIGDSYYTSPGGALSMNEDMIACFEAMIVPWLQKVKM